MPNGDAKLWELAEFYAREAFLLRSFVEYLRDWPDPPEKKADRLQNWRTEIGLQLGNPVIGDHASEIFQKFRDAPPQEREALFQKTLADVYSFYF